jgi:hypothetical protein
MMPSYEITEKGFEILLGRAETKIERLKAEIERISKAHHEEILLSEKNRKSEAAMIRYRDVEIAGLRGANAAGQEQVQQLFAENERLKARLAACTQDRDREPIL